MITVTTIALAILCYLIGAIPFSLVIAKWIGGVDIRKVGSGNPGATNVLRNLGWKYGVLAAAADVAKGVLAAWLGSTWGDATVVNMTVCILAVIIGHCYPVYLQFKGGKAVATTAGVVLFMEPIVFLALAVVFILIIAVSRYVSLGSVIAGLLNPLLIYLILGTRDIPLLIFSLVAAGLIVYRHRENIQRLRAGTESKLTVKK